MKGGRLISVLILLVIVSWGFAKGAPYKPTWESLSSHSLPQWFDDGKFGLFIHWGVYSVPAWAPRGRYAEWYWHNLLRIGSPTWKYHRENYGEYFEYDDFIPMFKAEKYNPKEWIELAKAAGMKYIVITSKHHDGFCLWPSEYTSRDAGEQGPNRDLLGPLVGAARAQNLKIGFYYSFLDWAHPEYPDEEYYVEDYMHKQVKELVQRYDPDLLWGDGEWEYSAEHWRSKELVAWYYNQAEGRKEVVVNDRLGKATRGRYGDFYTSEYGKVEAGRKLKETEHKWEENRGIGYSFGYNRNEPPEDYLSVDALVEMLVDTVSRGGNLLLDIGPKANGEIPEIQRERLKKIGKWLRVNHEAIYGTRPWITTSEGDLRFTRRGDIIYAIALKWPGEELKIESIKAEEDLSVRMLGLEGKLKWRRGKDSLIIHFPPYHQRPCEHAWVVKLSPLSPRE